MSNKPELIAEFDYLGGCVEMFNIGWPQPEYRIGDEHYSGYHRKCNELDRAFVTAFCQGRVKLHKKQTGEK